MKNFIVVLLAALIMGCAHQSDTVQGVSIRSQTPGYRVMIDGKQCTTPCELENVSRLSTMIYVLAKGNIVPLHLKNTLDISHPLRTINPVEISDNDLAVKLDDDYTKRLNDQIEQDQQLYNRAVAAHEEQDSRSRALWLSLLAAPAPVNGGQPALGYVRPDAYGPGVSMDATGRPVTLQPAYPNQGGYYGDSKVQTPNGYGLGVHIDQYGRPVQYR